MSGPFAFVTLLSSDSYLPGALVLAASLRDLHPTPPVAPEVEFKTVCLVTPETVDVKSVKALRKAYDIVIGVEVLESENSAHGLQLLGRPDLNTVLTKLHVFRLTEFSKIIFLDADVLPLQPISHLFLTPHEFSACPDVGWPDIFNSGCMVLQPGEDKFQQLISLVKSKGSWDGGDQGLLNEWRGSNWNRLSFTYNTTPTAAYTYAPAYQRFGSTIKAIHFIGQNKPWISIPWRAPIDHPSAESMNSYGYSNLVDRWFAVYDRHYRPPVVATEEEYLRQHHTPAWGVSASETGAQGLGLDELRRLAIEGVATGTSTFTGTSGDGEYRSMPLDGRIDLMRPKPVETGAQSPGGAGAPSDGTLITSSVGQDPNDSGYRPPGREGLPSYLYQPPPVHHEPPAPAPPEQSPPLQDPNDMTPRPIQHHIEHPPWSHDHQDSQQRQGSPPQQEYRPPSPPLLSWDPAKEPPPHNPPPVAAAMAFTGQQYQNVWDLPPTYPIRHHQHGHQPHWTETNHQGHGQYQEPWRGHQSSPQHPYAQHGRYQEPWFGQHSSPHHHDPSRGQGRRVSPTHHQHYHQHHHGHQHHHHHHHPHTHHQQQPYHQHHSSSGSPPYQPPQHGVPGQPYPGPPRRDHQQHQPSPDTYRGQEYQQWNGTSHQPHPHQTRPEDFFHAPAPSQIPSRLINEGHYNAVTTSDPRPDWTKVEPVFPWERRTRPTPRRVFPDWDPKPPGISTPPSKGNAVGTAVGTAVVSSPPAPPEFAPEAFAPMRRSPSPPPPPHIKRKFNPPPSPPKRQGGIYSNAWDVDYGIQRYAATLQGRPTPFSPMPWPTHPGQEAIAAKKKGRAEPDPEEEQEFTVWAERAEASSRDGDDEDDEEEESSPVLSPKSAARRRAAKAKGKSYRHQGVQTEPKKTEDRGVQVSIITMPAKRPYEFGSSAQQRPQKQSFGMQHSSPPAISGRYSPLQHRQEYLPVRDEVLGDPAFLPSAEITALAASVVGRRDDGLPVAQILRKRESSEDSVTTAAESSIIASPQKEANEMGAPRVGITVPEPMEQPAITARPALSSEGSVRRVSRVFSPTTGVDIFKRGSEEVLARFLMQQPAGWDAAPHSPGPPTPSAIH